MRMLREKAEEKSEGTPHRSLKQTGIQGFFKAHEQRKPNASSSDDDDIVVTKVSNPAPKRKHGTAKASNPAPAPDEKKPSIVVVDLADSECEDSPKKRLKVGT